LWTVLPSSDYYGSSETQASRQLRAVQPRRADAWVSHVHSCVRYILQLWPPPIRPLGGLSTARPCPSGYSSKPESVRLSAFRASQKKVHLRRDSPHPHHLAECHDFGRFEQRFLSWAWLEAIRLAASGHNGVVPLSAFPPELRTGIAPNTCPSGWPRVC